MDPLNTRDMLYHHTADLLTFCIVVADFGVICKIANLQFHPKATFRFASFPLAGFKWKRRLPPLQATTTLAITFQYSKGRYYLRNVDDDCTRRRRIMAISSIHIQ